MDTQEAIMTRRSIRHLKPDPIDDAAIEKILEAGRWAPSWANTQCWRFIVVRDAKAKEDISGCLIDMLDTGKGYINPGLKAVLTAPVIIVVCARIGVSGCRHGDSTYVTDKGDWYLFDTALAIENMLLAAHELGLGTVIMGAFHAPEVEKVLGIPEGYRVVTLLPLGVPAREGKAPPRLELDEITFRDRWGNKY